MSTDLTTREQLPASLFTPTPQAAQRMLEFDQQPPHPPRLPQCRPPLRGLVSGSPHRPARRGAAGPRRRFHSGPAGALLRNSRSRRTGPRSSSASVHALRSWHSKLRHPVQHSALDRGFDFLVLDRAGREAYPEYRLVP